MQSILLHTNEATAVVMMALLVLLLIGYGSALRQASLNTFQGCAIVTVAIICTGVALRSGYYDIYRPIGGYFEWHTYASLRVSWQVFNAICNAIISTACLFGLKGLHVMIPDHDRRHYSWLTAPFYPTKRTIARRLKMLEAQNRKD